MNDYKNQILPLHNGPENCSLVWNQEIDESIDHQRPDWSSDDPFENGNRGLLFDKFCFLWNSSKPEEGLRDQGNDDDDLKGKNAWLRMIMSGFDGLNPGGNLLSKSCGDSKQLETSAYRRKRLLESKSGKVYKLTSTSRLAIGLGDPNPVENGFTWHQTLGVPFIPATSMKGSLRSYLMNWDDDSSQAKNWFGVGQEESRKAGNLVILDAIPRKPVDLTVDIMTPHNESYREGQGRFPGGWDSPKPIPFLAVCQDTTFTFGVMPRQTGELESVPGSFSEVLESTLHWTGVGAKTAAGYGRFEVEQV